MAIDPRLAHAYQWFFDTSDGTFNPPDDFPSSSAWVRFYLEGPGNESGYSETTLISRLSRWRKGEHLPIGRGARTDIHGKGAVLAEPVQGEASEPRYLVADGKYHFENTAHGPFSIPVDAVDDIAFWYSRKGADWSSRTIKAEISRKYDYDLAHWKWLVITKRLRIYKDGNIFSEWTWENTPPGEREQMVEERMAEKAKFAPTLIEQAAQRQRQKDFKEVIVRDQRRQLFVETFYQALHEYAGPNPLGGRRLPFRTPRPGAPDNLVAYLADLHYGAKVEYLPATMSYDTEILRRQLADAAEEINAMGANQVTIVILGDLIESWTGNNKPSTWLSLERGKYGARAMWGVTDLIIEFLSNVRNLRRIRGIPGNHDRGAVKKEDEPVGQIALAIYEYLKRHTPYDVESADMVLSEVIEGVNHIWGHGDYDFMKSKKGKEWFTAQILKYGKSGMYNQVVSAHFHTLQTRHDDLYYQHMTVPPMIPGSKYASGFGASSNPRVAITTFSRGRPYHHFAPVGELPG